MTERPAIVSIEETREVGEARVVITLAWQDERHRGEARGSVDPELRPRIIGEATLRAVESVTGGRVRLHLGAVATAPLGGVRVAMAQVELEGDDGPFVGSVVLRGDDTTQATVRAVLDAINRRLSRLL